MKTALVTGGGGFVGDKLCRHLLQNGYSSVTAFDIHHSNDEEEDCDGLQKIKGDICDYSDVLKVMTSSAPTVVFHLASYGMSGKEMLDKTRIEAVNVNGTVNVINACIAVNIHCLVYTSTYNVVFGGQEIIYGDESLAYFPLEKHVDNYSRTKAIAEKLVLGANESVLANGKGTLRVCSLRCAGIYGEGERRHLPRIVSYIEKGMFCFTYGSTNNLVEFLHWENFVIAHCLVAKALNDNPCLVTGKPYFISDGKPINNFFFFKPLVEGLGYSYPSLRIPFSLIYFFAFLSEIIHGMISKYLFNFQPLLTRAEVFKTGVTHYFNIDAAKREFGYQPLNKDLQKTVTWFKDRGHGRKRKRSSALMLIVLILACVIWLLFLSLLPTVN